MLKQREKYKDKRGYKILIIKITKKITKKMGRVE